MVHKSCPDCDQQVPVACKACYCGFRFFEKKKSTDNVSPSNKTSPNNKTSGAEVHTKSQISSDNIIGGSSATKSRRTSRTKRERPDYYSASEYENQIRRLSRASVSSEKGAVGVELPSPRKKRGRPRKHGNTARRSTLKKEAEKPQEERVEEKDVDVYANIPPDEAFVYMVVLADINRKLQAQWQGPKTDTEGANVNGATRRSTTSPIRRTRRNSELPKS
ncbi:uncharacterized protein [Amphiura filiformis]|uniref:uncharacterized protein n=1 Tax=Amphiura filiformis TaxID=82378 RepID=UPI003B21D11A